MNDIEKAIADRMQRRLEKFFKVIALLIGPDTEKYWVAGNSCNVAAPNDFDLYCKDGFDLLSIVRNAKQMKLAVVGITRNALTIIINNKPVQFCNYKKPSLEDLIESFDFAHIQIGVEVTTVWDENMSYTESSVEYAVYTNDWAKAHMLVTTWYTGSEYPLSSLMRCVKYAQRGDFAGRSWKVSMLQILDDIISRGYENYQDFKDQMAAVDLMLLEPSESNAAWKLYNTCGHKNLVNRYRLVDIETAEEIDDDN